MKSSLNLKQERFAIEYLVDLNGTRAAIRAGYSGRSASTIAERLLRKVEIQKLISERRDAISKNLEIDNEWFVKKAVKLYETAIALDQNGRM